MNHQVCRPLSTARHAVRRHVRVGAVIPLFAVLLPVLVLLCAFAINLAYIQLTTTELRIATDAAARAGGRAFSEYQTTSAARQVAASAASQNLVAGAGLVVSTNDADNEIEFGLSQRSNNGYGRYQFTKKNAAAVDAGTEQATSVRVTGRRVNGSGSGSVPLLFGGVGDLKVFSPVVTSICTQVDRDIALVLDRSGSMSFHEDWSGDARGQSWSDLFAWCQSQMDSYQRDGGHTETYVDRRGRTRTRFVWDDPNLEAAYNAMQAYYDDITDYYNNSGRTRTPNPSRWDALVAGVNAFLDVLEFTDQEERVSLGSFASSGQLDLALQSTYGSIRNWVRDAKPWGGTAIDSGMLQSIDSVYASMSRPYAAKTIVVLTDGQNNAGGQAVINAARSIVASHNITIHTVTFSPGADQATMTQVADIGGGRHYHADDASGLIDIFEEIANNLPTIMTQ